MKKNSGIDYEKIVQSIYQQILDESDGVETITVQHNVIMRGKSGSNHQIDVYWEFVKAGITYRTIVQAKEYKQKVTQGLLIQFAGVIQDLPIGTQGIFITTEGYQKGAIQFASHNGIKLCLLKKSNENGLGIYMSHFTRHVSNICVKTQSEESEVNEIEDAESSCIIPYEQFIFFNKLRQQNSIYDILAKEFEKQDCFKIIPQTRVIYIPAEDLFICPGGEYRDSDKVISIEADIFTTLSSEASITITNVAKFILDEIDMSPPRVFFRHEKDSI